MKEPEELRQSIAKYLYELWKQDSRSLLIGGYLKEPKRQQYDLMTTKWGLLDPMYKDNFLSNADEIINQCLCNVDTLVHMSFNDG